MTCLVDPKRMIMVSPFYFNLFVILLKHIHYGFWWGHFWQLLRTFVKTEDPHSPVSFAKTDEPLKAMGAPPSTNQRVSLPCKLTGVLSDGRPLSAGWAYTDGRERRQVLLGFTWSSQMLIEGNILHITWGESTTDSYLPHMERHPTIIETLAPDPPHKEKSPLLRVHHSPPYKH